MLSKKDQDRIKSPVLWTSIFSLILLVFNTFGLFELMGIEESNVKNLFDGILTVGVAYGIFNNPTNGEGF